MLSDSPLWAQSNAAEWKAGRVDLHGDPLPPGAVARLGTLRFRPGTPVQWLRFSADGRQVLTADQPELGRSVHIGRVWSASTGKELASFLIPSENFCLVTPDCQRLLTWGGPTVRIWDTATGKLLRELPVRGNSVREVALAEDGRTLAALLEGEKDRMTFRLWSLPEGRLRQEIGVAPTIEGTSLKPYTVSFAAGGKVLAAQASSEKEEGCRHWDLVTGRELPLLARWSTEHAAALSPDGKLLAAAGKQGKSGAPIRLLDMATGKLRHRLGPVPGRVFGFRFSPDSGTLLAAGKTDDEETLHLWDTSTGKPRPAPVLEDLRIKDVLLSNAQVAIRDSRTVVLCDMASGKPGHRLKTPPVMTDELHQTGYLPPKTLPGRSRLAFSPDGTRLASALEGPAEGLCLRLWDTSSGKEVCPAEGGHDRSVVSVAFAPDGKTVASVSEDGTARLWDTSGRPLQLLSVLRGDDEPPARMALHGAYRLAFSPDGKVLTTTSPFNWVRQWEVRTGKLRGQHLLSRAGLSALAHAPDGNTLLLGSLDGVLFWDATAARERAYLAAPALPTVRSREAEDDYWLLELAISPDARLLAVSREDADLYGDELRPRHELQLWELAGGKMRWRIPNIPAPSLAIPSRTLVKRSRFPEDDGRPRVAFACGGKSLVWNHEGVIEQVDVARGRTLRRLEGRAHEVTGLACSRASRLLATVHKDGSVRLLDLATGADHWLHGHRGGVRCVAFSPDGRTLATGGDDTTVLIWDVAEVLKREPSRGDLSASELPRLWEQLASPHGETAAAAMARLQEAPTQAVSLLRHRLAPRPRLDPREMARLLDDLDSSSFETRRSATAALERLGEMAAPYLRRRLADMPPLEVERALQSLLTRAQGFVHSAEMQRALRAVEVLENIGAAEARDVLQKLAEGAPESQLTREAKASLQRLKRGPPVLP